MKFITVGLQMEVHCGIVQEFLLMVRRPDLFREEQILHMDWMVAVRMVAAVSIVSVILLWLRHL